MPRVDLKHISLRPAARFGGLAAAVHWFLLALFLVVFGFVWGRFQGLSLPLAATRWPEAGLVVLAAATTVAGLCRQLPGQNVMLACLLIAAALAAVQVLSISTGIPFGPVTYGPGAGPLLFEPLPVILPVLWLVLLLNSRGVARLILRPWRQSRAYGYWMLGLTAVLVVLLALGLEPFATQVGHYWVWSPTRIPSDWYSAPWSNFLGWGGVTLLIFAFVTPLLINKRPVKSPPDFYPLLLWLLFNALFVSGCVFHRLWGAVALITNQSLLVGLLAVIGMKRRPEGRDPQTREARVAQDTP